MAGNWWVNEAGKNALEQLPEWLVVDLLWRHPAARKAFDAAVALIEDEDEKERLTELAQDNKHVFNKPMRDPTDVADALQSKHNRAGVRTRMPNRIKKR